WILPPFGHQITHRWVLIYLSNDQLAINGCVFVVLIVAIDGQHQLHARWVIPLLSSSEEQRNQPPSLLWGGKNSCVAAYLVFLLRVYSDSTFGFLTLLGLIESPAILSTSLLIY